MKSYKCWVQAVTPPGFCPANPEVFSVVKASSYAVASSRAIRQFERASADIAGLAHALVYYRVRISRRPSGDKS